MQGLVPEMLHAIPIIREDLCVWLAQHPAPKTAAFQHLSGTKAFNMKRNSPTSPTLPGYFSKSPPLHFL